MLEIIELKQEDFSKYTQRIQMNSSDVIQPVQEIIANVCENKDKALHDYTLKFDKKLKNMRLTCTSSNKKVVLVAGCSENDKL